MMQMYSGNKVQNMEVLKIYEHFLHWLLQADLFMMKSISTTLFYERTTLYTGKTPHCFLPC